MALQTITHKNRDLQLRIHIPSYLAQARADTNFGQTIGEENCEQWLDLDRLLVKFWESRSIRPKVKSMTDRDVRDYVGHLLPEITKRGIIDLV